MKLKERVEKNIEFRTKLEPIIYYTDNGYDKCRSWVSIEFQGKDSEIRFSEEFDEVEINLENSPISVKEGFDGVIDLILKGEEGRTLRMSFWFNAAKKLVELLSRLGAGIYDQEKEIPSRLY